MKSIIATTNAPGAIGPYSQAVEANGFLFISGQLGIDSKTGEFAAGGVSEQTEQSAANIQAILGAAGCSFEDVVKTTVFLKDISDFAAMNEVYAKYFNGNCPARSAVEVGNLPKGGLVEIEAIVAKK